MIWTDGFTSLDTEGMVALLYERGQIQDLYLPWRINNKGGVKDFISSTAKAMEDAVRKGGCSEFRGWAYVPETYELSKEDLDICNETVTE